jgi:hypothetical protein
MAVKKSQQVAATSEEKAPEAVISFEDFLNEHRSIYNPGLIASFKYEAQLVDGLQPKTVKDWVIAFEEQSNRVY